ncbi:hypothetical protein CAL7716_101560 (plasmid) [Calothrix sp. PCC 7716]|nr:hypothetical protein CAL7716_101560 [Calothrix sp. PCC 7716]
MFKLPIQSKYTMPDKTEVRLPISNYEKALNDISNFVNKFN